MPARHFEQRWADFPIDADQMATQTIQYMDILAEHSVHTRGCHDVAQRLVDEGQIPPHNAPWPLLDRAGEERLRLRMGAIIHGPATTVEDHFKVCRAAHTLLFLHHSILTWLPPSQSCVIEEKINKLRAERRERIGEERPEQSRLRLFVRVIPPPVGARPAGFKSQDVADMVAELEAFAAVKPRILSMLFRLKEADRYFRVQTIRFFKSYHEFSIRFEDARNAITVDEETLRSMLEQSEVIDPSSAKDSDKSQVTRL